jgi:hypothetical protein
VLTVGIARTVRYSFWAFMGAAYGDRGLALLRQFDQWFLQRGELFLAAALAVLVAVLVWALRRRSSTRVSEAR